MRRIVPTSLDAPDLDEAYHDPRRGPAGGRPWVLVNMIATLDGATTVAGLSGGLGGPGDRAVFAAIRRQADVVLVGAATVRAEQYGPPKRPGQRIVVVSRQGHGLDPASPLFESGAGIVAVPHDAPELPAGLPVLRAGRGTVDLGLLLRRLHDTLDARVVLAEGGPSLNGQLLADGLVDEWCLTVAPRLVAGASLRPAVGDHLASNASDTWHLEHLLEDDGFVFVRYLRAPPEG
jgi:riboflavin biosynthesis pyrimidine reductase